MFAFNVWLGGKKIDTVFSKEHGTIVEKCEQVRKSLIGHDGYDPEITVTWPKGQRVTRDSYDLEADYGYGNGYEVISSSDTMRDAKQTRKEYRENGDYAHMRIVKRRERV